jgi:hypothetical protein
MDSEKWSTRTDENTKEIGNLEGGMVRNRGVSGNCEHLKKILIRFFVSFSGFGRWKNPNGDEYEGNFDFDARHGQGVYRWKNGNEYRGNFDRKLAQMF